MKSLQTLMRLQQRELDRLRKQMAALESKRDTLIAQIQRLHDELMREIEAANELAEMRGFFGDFSDSIKKRQHEIAGRVIKFEQQIQEMQIEIGNRFADLKKYEIAYDNYLMREAKKQAKKEQAQLDEAGLFKFLYGDS